jgi:hypothetical protein
MAGYVRFEVNGVRIVVREWGEAAIREQLTYGTLYDWAAAQHSPDLMQGRGVNYGVMFPAGVEPPGPTAVVVRRNRHGGMLRFLTKDNFIQPTRALLELETSIRLAAAGVSTPEVIACVVYPIAGVFARSDVMTRRLPEGVDFPAAWRNADQSVRQLLLAEVAAQLRSLAMAGAWHADLNLKNIYIAGTITTLKGYVLDVDRVTFPGAGDVSVRNFRRLARSTRKWRDRWGLDIGEDALERLADLALEKA